MSEVGASSGSAVVIVVVVKGGGGGGVHVHALANGERMVVLCDRTTCANPPACALVRLARVRARACVCTCGECTLLGLHVSSSKASATSLHLSQKKEAPCTPRTKSQQKGESNTVHNERCTLWWSALLCFSPVELPFAF